MAYWFSDNRSRDRMNQGTAWYELKERPDIFAEIDKAVPDLIKSIDAAGLFFDIPEDRCVVRFAMSLNQMSLEGGKVKIWEKVDMIGRAEHFQVILGDDTYKSEIFKGSLCRRLGRRGCFGSFGIAQLFLTKACYLLVSRSSPETRAHFEGAILQMSDFYETMMRSAERLVPYLVQGLYPVLNTRIKTLMLSCAEKGIYSSVPVEVWLLIKSVIGWDLG